MAQRLKRWESPRKSGRNEKGRGGSARQRQLKKQHKRLMKRLKTRQLGEAAVNENKGERSDGLSPFFVAFFEVLFDPQTAGLDSPGRYAEGDPLPLVRYGSNLGFESSGTGSGLHGDRR